MTAMRVNLKLPRDRRAILRVVVYLLLASNIVAAVLMIRPWGGSAQDLEQQLIAGRQQVKQRQLAIERLKLLVAKSERARKEGDRFLSAYFLDRRKASASILTEIGESSRKVGLRQRDGAFTFEPIEGSDSLSLMSIAVNFEGSYSDLVEFVHRMDASERFLIIEELQAAPTQVTGVLAIRMRVSAFVREEAPRS